MATATLEQDADAFVQALRPTAPPPPPVPSTPGTPPGPGKPAARHPLSDPQSPEFHALARQYGVDPALTGRMMQVESGGNPLAVSKKGAKGLFQLMDSVQQDYGVTDPFDPAQNVPAGMQYWRDLLKKHKGDTTLAAAEWNAGGVAVKRYGGVPPYKETTEFIQKVGATQPSSPQSLARDADAFVQALGGGTAQTLYHEPYSLASATALRHGTPAQPRPGVLPSGRLGPPTPTSAQRATAQDQTTAREAGLPAPPVREEPLEEPALVQGLAGGSAGVVHQLTNLAGVFQHMNQALQPDAPTPVGGTGMQQAQQVLRRVEAALRTNPEALQQPQRLDDVIMRAIGEAIPQLMELTVLGGGTLALAGVGALSAVDQGPAQAALQGIKGAVMGRVLHTLGGLPTPLRVAGGAAVMGGEAYRETGDPQQGIAHGVVGGALMLPGERFSDWVDRKNAAYQARADARHGVPPPPPGAETPPPPPPGATNPHMDAGMRWYQAGQSRNNVRENFIREFGMNPTEARAAADRAYDAWSAWLKDRMGVKDEPESSPPPPPGSQPPPAGGSAGDTAPPSGPSPSGAGAGGGPGPRTPTGGAGGALVPTVPPPRPGDLLTKHTGTLYAQKAQADFALTHRNDVDATTHVVIEDPPGTWVIRSKEQIHAEDGQQVQRLADIGAHQVLTPDEQQWMASIIQQGGGAPDFAVPEPLQLPAGPPPRPSRRTWPQPPPERPEVIPLPGTPAPLGLPAGRERPTPRPAPSRPQVIALASAGQVAPRLAELVDQIGAFLASDTTGHHPDDVAQAIQMLRTRGKAARTHYGDTPPTQIQPLLKQLTKHLKALDQQWDMLHPAGAPASLPATPAASFGPEDAPTPPGRPYLFNDPVYQAAVRLVQTHDRATATWLAGQMGITHTKAERYLRRMEEQGFLTPAQYPQPRQVVPGLVVPSPASPPPQESSLVPFGEEAAPVPVSPPPAPSAIAALFGDEPAATLPQDLPSVPAAPSASKPSVSSLPGAGPVSYGVGQVVTFTDPTTGQPTQGTVQRPFFPGGPDTRVTVRVQGSGAFAPPRAVFVEPEAILQGEGRAQPSAAVSVLPPELPVLPPAPIVHTPAPSVPVPPVFPESTLYAMRLLGDRNQAQRDEARSLGPGHGTKSIGSADIDFTLKAIIGDAYLRTLRQTGDEAQALTEARKAGRAFLAQWNTKGVKGRVAIASPTEMQRWEGSADSLAEQVHYRFLRESKLPVPVLPPVPPAPVSHQVIERLSLSDSPEAKQVGAALDRVAPAVNRLREAIQAGERFPLDISDDVVSAAHQFVVLAETGETVERWLDHGTLSHQELSPLAKEMLRLFAMPPFQNNTQAITDLLSTYLERVDALGSPQQKGLFGPQSPPTTAEVFHAAIRRFEEQSGAQETVLPTLFANEPAAGEGDSGLAESPSPSVPAPEPVPDLGGQPPEPEPASGPGTGTPESGEQPGSAEPRSKAPRVATSAPTRAKAKPAPRVTQKQRQALLTAYFTPGSIVKSYAGQDRVLSFDAETGVVRVIAVDKAGQVLPDERERAHSTHPSNEELKKALAKRAQEAGTPPTPPDV